MFGEMRKHETMENFYENKTFNKIFEVLFILCLFTMPFWGVIANLFKPKELSVLDIEMGEFVSVAEIALKKRYGEDNVCADKTSITINDVEVDGVVFNKVEFISNKGSLVHQINLIVVSKAFKEKSEAKSFLNAYKLKLIEKTHSKNEPDCERFMHNGKEAVSYILLDDEIATGVSFKYDCPDWVVTICYYKMIE